MSALRRSTKSVKTSTVLALINKVRPRFAYRFTQPERFYEGDMQPWIASIGAASAILLLSSAHHRCAAFTQPATSVQPYGRAKTMSLTGERPVSGDPSGVFDCIENAPQTV
jgi:hypothetical protein